MSAAPPAARPFDALGADYRPPGAAPVPTHARAVVFDAPGVLALRELALTTPKDADVVVDVEWSAVSAGTERLFWRGTMPPFPGMGYPLVPGYETVGRVRWAGPASGRTAGERVFLPGAYSFSDARNLFGGAARTLVAPGSRAVPVGGSLGAETILLALAATAMHAVGGGAPAVALPDLIVGHGALGRLAARIVIALGGRAPTVWECEPARASGAEGYAVTCAEDDPRRAYRCALDASGAAGVIDLLVPRLAKGGEVVLGGFYTEPLSFQYVPAFMRGLRLRVAAEWTPGDLAAAAALVADGRLSLGGLITHTADAADGPDAVAAAYATAFDDARCVKMVLDWRRCP